MLFTCKYIYSLNQEAINLAERVESIVDGQGTVTANVFFRVFLESHNHRRRIETEGKAKVVVSVWGAEFVQFLAALAVLSQLF